MRLSDEDDVGELLNRYCDLVGDVVEKFERVRAWLLSSSDDGFSLKNRGCVDSEVVVDVGDHDCPSFTGLVSGVVVEVRSPSTPCIMVEG